MRGSDNETCFIFDRQEAHSQLTNLLMLIINIIKYVIILCFLLNFFFYALFKHMYKLIVKS
jgi:hypothetical protein